MASKSDKKEKKEKKDKAQYVLTSDKINILLMGTSGAGKSTLINSVIPTADAPTGEGRAVTLEMRPYGEEGNPLVLIDSVGYEYSILRQVKLKNEINKWIKTGVKKEDASKLIHMIWFCIDGQSKRVFDEVLDSIRNVALFWKDIPIIIVFTKSYGTEEDDLDNIKMFKEVLASYKHNKDLNIKEKDIIPVVAKEKNTAAGTIPVKGLDRLVERTRELSPEAQKVAEKAVRSIELRLKKTEANAIVSAGTVGAATIGAIPIGFPDAALLVPLQSAMLAGISKIYEIGNKDVANQVVEAAMKAGATTLVGKQLIVAIKNIPGIQIAGAVLNAAVAGIVTGTVGETSVIVFEKILKGEIVISDDIDWIGIVSDIFSSKLPNFIESIAKNLSGKDIKELPSAIANAVMELMTVLKEEKGK